MANQLGVFFPQRQSFCGKRITATDACPFERLGGQRPHKYFTAIAKENAIGFTRCSSFLNLKGETQYF
jgi:hypothetical protein